MCYWAMLGGYLAPPLNLYDIVVPKYDSSPSFNVG